MVRAARWVTPEGKPRAASLFSTRCRRSGHCARTALLSAQLLPRPALLVCASPWDTCSDRVNCISISHVHPICPGMQELNIKSGTWTDRPTDYGYDFWYKVRVNDHTPCTGLVMLRDSHGVQLML